MTSKTRNKFSPHARAYMASAELSHDVKQSVASGFDRGQDQLLQPARNIP